MAAFERQGREMVLGALIIIGLIAFSISLFFFDAVIVAFQDHDEIEAILPAAPKLTVGAEVWIGGKHVGEVTRVSFVPFRGDSMERIGVTLRLPHDVHDQVRKDSRIRITSARIIGAPVIDITPGTAGSPLLGPEDTLFMKELVTPASLAAKVTIIKASFDTATKEIKALSGPARERMNSLAPMMRSMTVAQTEMASLMDAVGNGAAADFMADGQFKSSLGSLQTTASALGPAFAKARENLSGTQQSLAPSLTRMQGNAERLSAAIGELRTMMATENGTLHRMSADSALLKSLDGVKAQLDSLIQEAKKNPLKFVF